ncbi:DEKNAAC101153 [Brettanomyces naardenensis]|uniref:DEKNAAC101153 n=1 Tax=Brettanomyces naardenensis TaxID=13370 RepID=A0A448YHD3_BRENA|nr:DEKNAAC101153 [Brettanomyces naardenensis]
MLNGDNEYKIMVPYIFVTNGGGKPESVRAKDLSQRLGCEINEGQIIQGHTPMKGLASTYKNVLVVGGVGDTCRKIAEGYGFQNVYIPLDIMYWNPAVSPYYTLSDEEKKVSKKGLDFSQIEIEAILVFADSRNWAVDEQIILELLMSKDGRMGTVSKDYTEGPGIYFAHSDFIWSTDYKLSRYGMGALQVSIAALYRETTGKELKVTRFGKPQRGTFKYAEKVLSKWRIDVLEEYVDVLSETNGDDKKKGKKSLFTDTSDDDSGSDEDEEDDGLTLQSLAPPIPEASTVYFVGDTPDSDIRFANAHDGSWFSILVKTGVYKEGTVPKYKPKKICDNVLEAVKYGIDREAKKEMEEWRRIRTK